MDFILTVLIIALLVDHHLLGAYIVIIV